MTAPAPETRVTQRVSDAELDELCTGILPDPYTKSREQLWLLDLRDSRAREAALRTVIHDAINALPAPVKDDVVCGKLADHIRHLAAERDNLQSRLDAILSPGGEVGELAAKAIWLLEPGRSENQWHDNKERRSAGFQVSVERAEAALTAVLPAIRAQERAATIEECAKVLERCRPSGQSAWDEGMRDMSVRGAAAIRALAGEAR